MKGLPAILCLATSFAAAQSISVPRVGLVRDRAARLRLVMGIGGNLVAGPAFGAEVLSAGFTGRAGLVKTAERIIELGLEGEMVRSFPAPPGPALFAFSPGGEPALVWFKESGQVLRYQPAGWEPAPGLTAERDVLALSAPGPDVASMVVRREGLLWLVRKPLSGGPPESESALPDVTPPVFLWPDGTLVCTGSGKLLVRWPDGREESAGLTAPITGIEEMGPGWLHLRGHEHGMGLQFLTTGLRVYELPGGEP